MRLLGIELVRVLALPGLLAPCIGKLEGESSVDPGEAIVELQTATAPGEGSWSQQRWGLLGCISCTPDEAEERFLLACKKARQHG
jgi:hypothetical protein